MSLNKWTKPTAPVSTTAPPVLTPCKLKPNLLNLKKFNGKTYKFNIWLPVIRTKLRIDGLAIGNSTA